jgi:biotin operon repressor
MSILNTTRDDLDFSLKTVWEELKALRVEVEGLRLVVEDQGAEIRALKKKGRGVKAKQRTTAKGVESS